LHIKDGCLLINKSAFSEKRLRSWNTARWMSSVKVNKRQSSEGISPAKLLYHFLGQLDKDQWFSAHDLGPLLKTAFPDSDLPETGIICEKGLQRGCLAGTMVENTPYYRLNDNDNNGAGRRPEDFLAKVDDSCFTIDIDLAPFKDLELLAEICRLRISSGKLTAEADFVRLNRSLKKAEKEDVFVWLRQNLRQFDNTVKNIKKRRNKIIVHKNIMTARIRDLGLKLLIEKKYGSTGRGGVISLGDEFIAFPRSLLYEIGNLAKKAGHVIKTVSQNDD
ncbi:MAG: hypothetical protein GY868_02275, partial [Deltaproteobacteria bacterium]|nr:hypothetical protein [Deltaproteobacteria bacterium]